MVVVKGETAVAFHSSSTINSCVLLININLNSREMFNSHKRVRDTPYCQREKSSRFRGKVRFGVKV